MKSFTALCLFGLLAVGLCAYTTKYDGTNIDEILENERLMDGYFKCMVDLGGCTADANELKATLPDAIQTDCAECNDTQKAAAKKVIAFLINKKPEMWNQLCAKYDPDNIHRSRHEKELKEIAQ